MKPNLKEKSVYQATANGACGALLLATQPTSAGNTPNAGARRIRTYLSARMAPLEQGQYCANDYYIVAVVIWSEL